MLLLPLPLMMLFVTFPLNFCLHNVTVVVHDGDCCVIFISCHD